MGKNFNQTPQQSQQGADLHDMFMTRSGLLPDRDKLYFTIKTQYAQEFLQKRMNVAMSEIRKNGYTGDDIEVRLVNTKLSDTFAPFMIILPMCIIDKADSKADPEELGIFRPADSGNRVRMYRPIMQLLRAYAYTKEDINALSTPNTMNSLNLHGRNRHEFITNVQPRIRYLGGVEKVVMMLDPLRLFSDMLVIQMDYKKGVKHRLNITIDKKINSGQYIFKVLRTIGSKEDGHKKFDIESELIKSQNRRR